MFFFLLLNSVHPGITGDALGSIRVLMCVVLALGVQGYPVAYHPYLFQWAVPLRQQGRTRPYVDLRCMTVAAACIIFGQPYTRPFQSRSYVVTNSKNLT